MVQRDYASRKSTKKKKSGRSKIFLFAIVIVLIIGFCGGLYFLKQSAINNAVTISPTTTKQQPKTVLPSHLEERWTYIKELETREIPIDNSPDAIVQNAQLSEEQKKLLLQMEQDRKATEIAKQKQLEQTNHDGEKSAVDKILGKAKTEEITTSQLTTNTVHTENFAVNKKMPEVKKVEVKTAEKEITTEQSKATGHFGLQCGAFKNKAQAETLKAKLAMVGFNAKIVSSADWNRVFIGPSGDKAAAEALQTRVKSIVNCVVIGM